MKRPELPLPIHQAEAQDQEWLQFRTIDGYCCAVRRDYKIRLLEEHIKMSGHRWFIVTDAWNSEVRESEFRRIKQEIEDYDRKAFEKQAGTPAGS